LFYRGQNSPLLVFRRGFSISFDFTLADFKGFRQLAFSLISF